MHTDTRAQASQNECAWKAGDVCMTAAESPERAYIASSSGDAVFAASRFELAAQLQPLRATTDRCRHTAALRLFERPGAEKLMVRFANDVSLAHVMYLVHEHEVLHRYAHGGFV